MVLQVADRLSDLPTTVQFESRVIRWSPDGKGVALLDRDVFCCAFEVADSDMPEGQ
jgi:hypothetical protein